MSLSKIVCPECSDEMFYDGSAAGSEIPCPSCGTALIMPGTKPDIWKAKTDAFEYAIYGQHPVQAEGFVGGHPFYFRAKWNFWDFTVCTNHDYADAGSQIDPPDDTPGFFKAGDYEGYWLGEDFGNDTDASHMDIETSRTILEKCLNRFLEDLRNR